MKENETAQRSVTDFNKNKAVIKKQRELTI